MAETLGDLIAKPAHIFVGEAEQILVKPITIGIFEQMLTLCEPVLKLTIEHEEKLDDFEKLAEIVVDDVQRFKDIVELAAGVDATVTDRMTLEQLIHNIGVLIGQNPLFFSRLKRVREKMKAQTT